MPRKKERVRVIRWYSNGSQKALALQVDIPWDPGDPIGTFGDVSSGRVSKRGVSREPRWRGFLSLSATIARTDDVEEALSDRWSDVEAGMSTQWDESLRRVGMTNEDLLASCPSGPVESLSRKLRPRAQLPKGIPTLRSRLIGGTERLNELDRAYLRVQICRPYPRSAEYCLKFRSWRGSLGLVRGRSCWTLLVVRLFGR